MFAALTSRCTVSCARAVAFPKRDFHDRQSFAAGVLENEASNVLGRRISRNQHEGFAQRLEEGNGRVVFTQDHAVVQFGIDPGAKRAFDVGKIDEHAALVERFGFQHDDGFSVMAVQMPTLPRVIEQAVSVAKIDLLTDAVHGG
jgi:hypothetical protein